MHPIPQPSEETPLLMWNMVAAMGINLTQAVSAKRVSSAKLSRMAWNCHHCPAPQACGIYLDRRDGQTQTAPSFCPNRKKLAALRARFPNADPFE